MGIFGLAMMFAPAVGPTLSGWVIENYSWRIMFYSLVPVGVIVIIVGFFIFKNIDEPKKIKLDTPGAILSIVGFAALLYGVSEAGSDGFADDPIVLSTVVIGVIGIAAFIIQQLKSKEPMLDFRVFKYDMFSLSSVINAIISCFVCRNVPDSDLFAKPGRFYSASVGASYAAGRTRHACDVADLRNFI